MKRLVFLALFILVFHIGISLGAEYGGGSGTTEDPYQIGTAEELVALGQIIEDYDKCFVLTADINLSGNTFNRAVIAPDTEDANHSGYNGTPFTGVFDGGGHQILNLRIEGDRYLGLFGQLSSSAVISNLGLENVDIHGIGRYAGGLCGTNGSENWESSEGGTINTCYVTGTVSGNDYVGGLIGQNSGSIAGCFSNSVITGENCVGGLVGKNFYGSTINASYSSGSVTGKNCTSGLVGLNLGSITACYGNSKVTGEDCVGGLVGKNHRCIIASYSSSMITSQGESIGGLVGLNSFRGDIAVCYSTGMVSGQGILVGGLIGWNLGSVTASYSSGKVTGDGFVGGLIGENQEGEGIINASFWDVQTSEQSGSAGGMGLTTGQMQQIDTFMNARWDFVNEIANGTCDYWQISQGDYPRLCYGGANHPVMPEGLGTHEQPYLIQDARDLGTVWFEPLAYYRMETSMDLSESNWSMSPIPWFDGHFDGNGYVISNLSIQGSRYLGLFGEVSSKATVSNLGVQEVNIYATGDYIGSLAGWNCGGTITACYSTGRITGEDCVGGLVGINESLSGIEPGYITRCYSASMLTGLGYYIGGLVGVNNTCGEIISSYSIGMVTGQEYVGGLVGFGSGPTISSFWDIEASGQNRSPGGIGLTTAQMKTAGPFLDAGWDFINIWNIGEGQTYPYLRKYSAADFNKDNEVNLLDLSIMAEQWMK